MPYFESVRSKSLGNLTAFEKTPTGIIGKTDNGNFRICLYSKNICRISITHNTPFDEFSYSVVALPEPTSWELQESEDHLLLSTASFRLTISRKPVRFTFTDLSENIINQDDPLGTAWIGDQVTTYKKLQEGERFIGLGEKTGPLDRRGNAYQNWTTDAYAYHAGTDPLYCSTPFYIGIHHQQLYGIFLDNTYKSFFNFGASNNRFASFSADAGEMNYYFIYGSQVSEIIEGYTWLTGRMPLPPLWSIGYQQCRYSYYPEHEVLNVANTFRDKQIPADVLVLDIHYMDRYKIFTWDPQHFQNPGKMIATLKEKGFEVVLMCDPGIKIEDGYEPYDSGKAQDVFLKFPDGEYYSGQVWPGWCHFPDFTKATTRKWWADKFKSYVDLGVEGFWNDMNEIATWGNSLPENLEFDFEGNKSTLRRGRNIYGLQMARSTFEGTTQLLDGKRPFNLTRSAFSGIQRYSAVWTGDNVAYDDHMMLGVRLVNSMGLTGIAFAGYDVGGFVGDASSHLFARWISIGALSPFFRGHSMINSRDNEPWAYGEEVEQISRNYIRLRYQLLPYIYTLFYQASQSGIPVQRSLAIDYPYDHRVFDHQFHHQYKLGPFLLVAPVESSKEISKVFLPEGTWHYLHDKRTLTGNSESYIECPIHKLPVFIQESAILTTQQPVQTTKESVTTLEVHLYAGLLETSFGFYEDDGTTYQYKEGAFATRVMRHFPAQKKFIIDEQQGRYASKYKRLKLVWHRFEGSFSNAQLKGRQVTLNHEKHSFFLPYEKYDPINDPQQITYEDVFCLEFENEQGNIEITW